MDIPWMRQTDNEINHLMGTQGEMAEKLLVLEGEIQGKYKMLSDQCNRLWKELIARTSAMEARLKSLEEGVKEDADIELARQELQLKVRRLKDRVSRLQLQLQEQPASIL